MVMYYEGVCATGAAPHGDEEDSGELTKRYWAHLTTGAAGVFSGAVGWGYRGGCSGRPTKEVHRDHAVIVQAGWAEHIRRSPDRNAGVKKAGGTSRRKVKEIVMSKIQIKNLAASKKLGKKDTKKVKGGAAQILQAGAIKITESKVSALAMIGTAAAGIGSMQIQK